jgi:nicotinate-nucleotide adenylyltransferase
LGVLGGSFDPIHKGHLVAASAVAKALHLDRVLFVPAGNQWQKTQLEGYVPTSAEHRLEMTRLAIAGNPMFGISSIDVDRGTRTYTVDTLSELKKLYPHAELFFILGADAVAGIETWKDSAKLFDLATFVAVSRPGYSLSVPAKYADRIEQISIDALDISSTASRDLIAAGKSLESAVPAGVITYIKENNLYKEAE